MKPQRRTLKPSVIFFTLGIIATLSSRAQVYDVAADFCTSINPNGRWSYGWSESLGRCFYPYVGHDRMWELDLWRDQIDPNVTHNGTSVAIDTGFGIWPADQVAFHPGPNGEFSVVRWTAPRCGIVAIASAFTGFDYIGPTTTDVHLLVNGVSVFDGIVEGFGSSTSFNTNLSVTAGDMIDFAVGFGSNGNYGNDTTGLNATIAFDPPLLAILRSGTNVQISWPLNSSLNFVLQCSPTLSTPIPWQRVTNSPVVLLSNRVVTLPSRTNSSFFRLVLQSSLPKVHDTLW